MTSHLKPHLLIRGNTHLCLLSRTLGVGVNTVLTAERVAPVKAAQSPNRNCLERLRNCSQILPAWSGTAQHVLYCDFAFLWIPLRIKLNTFFWGFFFKPHSLLFSPMPGIPTWTCQFKAHLMLKSNLLLLCRAECNFRQPRRLSRLICDKDDS